MSMIRISEETKEILNRIKAELMLEENKSVVSFDSAINGMAEIIIILVEAIEKGSVKMKENNKKLSTFSKTLKASYNKSKGDDK